MGIGGLVPPFLFSKKSCLTFQNIVSLGPKSINMTLQLVKEFDRRGEVSYHITVDGTPVPDSTCWDLQDAMLAYEVIRSKSTKARSLVLIQEEL